MYDNPKRNVIFSSFVIMRDNWKSIVAIHDTKNNIIIFVGNALGIFIPKRAFQSELEAKKYYAKILEYYNNAKNL